MPGFAEQVVKALGINPEQLRESLNRVLATAQRVDANMIAAQTAVQQATAHFDGRLSRIENALAQMAAPGFQVGKLNGASQHDGRSIDPEPNLANLPGDNGAD